MQNKYAMVSESMMGGFPNWTDGLAAPRKGDTLYIPAYHWHFVATGTPASSQNFEDIWRMLSWAVTSDIRWLLQYRKGSQCSGSKNEDGARLQDPSWTPHAEFMQSFADRAEEMNSLRRDGLD